MPHPFDPVCGRRVDPHAAWERGQIIQHCGQTYCFCSLACCREFAWRPQAYVTPTDIVCGQAVDCQQAEAAGRYCDFKGRRYYFCSPRCRQDFGQTPRFYRDRWRMLQGLGLDGLPPA